MDELVVLLIVKQYLVIEDDLISRLAILVTRQDLENYSIANRMVGQFKLLACLVLLGAFLGELQELSADFMLQLHFDAVNYVLATLVDELQLVL